MELSISDAFACFVSSWDRLPDDSDCHLTGQSGNPAIPRFLLPGAMLAP